MLGFCCYNLKCVKTNHLRGSFSLSCHASITYMYVYRTEWLVLYITYINSNWSMAKGMMRRTCWRGGGIYCWNISKMINQILAGMKIQFASWFYSISEIKNPLKFCTFSSSGWRMRQCSTAGVVLQVNLQDYFISLSTSLTGVTLINCEHILHAERCVTLSTRIINATFTKMFQLKQFFVANNCKRIVVKW